MKKIGIVKLKPYALNDVVVVSCGMTQEEIWEYIDKSHVHTEGHTKKAFNDKHRKWKKLVMNKEVVKTIRQLGPFVKTHRS